MSSKNSPGEFDCYANAMPDEPMFVLLARDQSAPQLVRVWAANREMSIALGKCPKSDQAAVDEARYCAAEMERWRHENDGAWRKP